MANSSDIAKDTIRDFTEIQEFMKLAKEENAVKTYARLKTRYIGLKALLSTLGVNLAELDEIKE